MKYIPGLKFTKFFKHQRTTRISSITERKNISKWWKQMKKKTKSGKRMKWKEKTQRKIGKVK